MKTEIFFLNTWEEITRLREFATTAEVNGGIRVTIEDTMDKTITGKQMACIHIIYRQFAEALNNAGYDIQRAINMKGIRFPISFTEENVKEIFGRPVIRSLYPKKRSHTNLSTTETREVFEVLNAAMAKVFAISLPWPDRFNQ